LYSQGNDEVPMNAQSAVEIRQLQNALAEEHRKFVEAVTRSHSDFLQASQSLFGHASLDTTVAAGPENLGQPPLGAPVTPLAWECNEIASSATPSPAPGRADIAIPTSEPTSACTATPASAAVADTVRAVVAEKTGYPVDMLELDMDLEAELGIDSIKQVEILSALRERLPDMPQIDPARLASSSGERPARTSSTIWRRNSGV
jgi:Phosphopantetheine attachment site